MVEHLRCAMGLSDPFAAAAYTQPGSYEHRRNIELEAVAHFMARLGPGAYEEEVQRRMRLIDEVNKELIADGLTNRLYQQYASPHILESPMGRQPLALWMVLIHVLDLPDKDYPMRCVRGVVVGGRLEPTNCWDNKEFKQKWKENTFDELDHAAWNTWLHADMVKKAKSSEGAQKAKESREKSKKELKKGYARAPVTMKEMNEKHGEQGWRACRRFVVYEPGELKSDEWRVLDAEQSAQCVPGAEVEMRTAREAIEAAFRGRSSEQFEVSCALLAECSREAGVEELTTDCWLDVDGQRLAPRVPIRVIDDWSENLGNGTLSQWDKLRCSRADSPVVQARRLQREWKRRWPRSELPQLNHGCIDIEAAFRKILTATPQYFAVAEWDEEVGDVVYTELFGCIFGGGAAVTYFNAVPAGSCAAMRRLLCISIDHFFDDKNLVAFEQRAHMIMEVARQFMEAIGWAIKVSKTKPMARVNTFQGVVSDFSAMSAGFMQTYVTHSRKQRIVRRCREALVECTPLAAEKLIGQTYFSSDWQEGRATRAATQPLRRRALNGPRQSTSVTPELRAALEYLIDVIPAWKPRRVPLEAPVQVPLIQYTDASYEPVEDEPAAKKGKPDQHRPKHKGEGGFVLIVRPGCRGHDGLPEPRVLVSGEVTPQELFDAFIEEKKTYIGQLELLWGAVPKASVPELYAGTTSIDFIDNTGAVVGLIKGYATQVDSAHIVNADHAMGMALGTHSFREYVRTDANIADLPSRGKWEELVQVLVEALGIAPERIEYVVARMPPLQEWMRPASAWIRAVEQRGVCSTVTVPLVQWLADRAPPRHDHTWVHTGEACSVCERDEMYVCTGCGATCCLWCHDFLPKRGPMKPGPVPPHGPSPGNPYVSDMPLEEHMPEAGGVRRPKKRRAQRK